MSARLHEQLFDVLKAPVQRVGGTFSAVPMANVLEQAWIPSKDQVKAAIRTTLDWKK
jgi:pyruvate/2-oxoglutarate/acetoin dehydrogenase E1 component